MEAMEFSPPKHPPKRSKWFEIELPISPEDNVHEKPMLVLKPFSAVPHISFHKVKLGCTKSCDLYLCNPLDVSQVVKVEKVPTDKGFYLENEEYTLEPGEEKVIKIFWIPEKASSYRETISFKTSTGCKTHAYLLGTSYLPVKKVSQKCLPVKAKKHLKKKISPKSAKICSIISKGATVFDGLNICEEKKENLDFLNSKFDSYVNKPNDALFNCPSKTDPRASFCLKTNNEFPDSPIRRQTYTINSMLLSGRESQILPFPPNDSSNNSKTSNIWKRNQVELSLDNNYGFQKAHKVSVQNPLLTKLSCEDNLDDSLEDVKVKNVDIPANFNDSLSEVESNYVPVSFDTTCMKDCVKTYDIVNKHLYFGYTPQQSSRDEIPMFSRQFGCSRKTEIIPPKNKKNISAVSPNLIEQMNFSMGASNFDSCYFPYESNIDVTSFISELEKDKYKCESFLLDTSVGYPISEDSVFVKELDKNFKESHEIPHYEKSHVSEKVNEEFIASGSENINLQQQHDANRELFMCDNTSGKVLKETKTSLCIEIPNDPVKSTATASKFSKTTKKQPGRPFSTGHAFKKPSPLKKIVKSRVAASRDSSLKSLSANSKVISGTGNKETLTKRLPRKLCLLKPPRMSDAPVYQRNPFASMNIYYDERWIEKQEVAFTAWLNFILTPSDDFSSEDIKVDSAKLWIESIKETSSVPAPTNEELSLKAYTAARNLNALRKASITLYQSEDIVPVIKRIEREVDLKKINIRKDRAIHADLGIKKDILEMLLSYNTLWLRIGLETVYGEIITLQSNSDVLGLSRFIVHRFLNSPDICSKYSHPGVINYYKKGYDEAIQRFILKKFFLLVFFLDTAKNVHLIKHNPCLFNKNAKFKSSRSLLLAFSRDYLSGEGDITKHLRYLGCKVSYEQSALEEFDFSVRKLSVDLRCGLRLGRVVEILLQDWTVSQNLRINTLNRLTKIHNNDVILKALKNVPIEIENNIEAKHIVDGNREKTLDLLWQIIFKTQISKLINQDLLKRENAFLNRSLKLRADFAAYNALRKPECSPNDYKISVLDSKLYRENEILQLLFQWCQSVCAHYGIKVHNFTSSFSDGRVLCLLLHHYHHNVLPYGCIKFETTNSYFEKQMQLAETNENCPFFAQNGQSNTLMEELLKNERDNLTLVFQKFQEVGHIPILSCPSDMSNTMPDEKVTITLVSYLNMRLMELSIEIRAARKILHAWKKYKLRKQHENLKAEIEAVITIQKAWKLYLSKKRINARNNAAIKIQTLWRMYSAKKELMRLKEMKELASKNKNVICIQALFRGYLVRKRISEHNLAATIIQAYFRRWSARTRFVKLKSITCKIQQNFRARVIGQFQRTWYSTLCQNVIKLQAYSRGMLVRRQVEKKLISTVKIQAYVRMWLTRKKYRKMQSACIIIQQKFRGYLLTQFLSEEYQNHRSAAVSIQRWYRAVKFQQRRINSIIKIQAFLRSVIAKKKFITLKQNAIKIQTYWRAVSAGKKTRLDYVKTYRSIICIQSFVRQCIASQKYKRQKMSAIIIQKYIRRFIAKRKYYKLKRSVILIQNLWHSRCLARKVRSEFLSYRKKVIIVQSVIRRYIALCNYKRTRKAAIFVQKNVRALLLHKKFCQLKSSVCYIQRKWRAVLQARVTRTSYLLYRKKVIFIQSLIRMKIAYQSFRKKIHSATIIQKNFRMFIQRKQYLNLKKSVSFIQNCWRSILLARKIKEFLRFRQAAIAIQSLYRMYSCRKKFILLKKAVSILECYRIGKTQRKNYLKMKQSAVKLQSLFRGYLCKKEYLKSVRNVILIQACIRRFISRRQYLKTISSVVKIQRYFHGYKLTYAEKQRFYQVRNGIIKLQAAHRGRCVRNHLQLLHKNAIIIQSNYRRWKAQSEFKQLKQSCFVIQRRYRAKIEMKHHHHRYVKMRNSVIAIQAFVRGYLMRKQYRSLKMSVIKIQSYVRMIQCYRKYHKMKMAVRTIGQHYKLYKEMKAVRYDYLQKRSQIIYIQSKVRSLIARKIFLRKKKAVILLQSFIRMKLQQKKYLQIRNTVIFVQRYYRNKKIMKLQKISYTQQRHSVIYLQSKVRCIITRKKYLNKKQSIIYLQSKVRCMIARKRYLQQRQSIIYIQSKVRSKIAMKNYLQQRQSIIYLQSKVRCMIVRKKYILQRQSIIYLQSKVRCMIARKKYLLQKQSITYLQSKIRCVIARKKYLQQRQSIIYLQSKVRCKIARKKYLQQRLSIIYLQSKVRCMIARKKYLLQKQSITYLQSKIRCVIARKKYLQQRQSIIYLQSKVRCKIARKKYLQQRLSIIYLQSKFRCMIAMKSYLQQRQSIICLQSKVRCMIARNKYLHQRQSIIYLQSKVRCMIARKKYIQQRQSIIYLQSKVRYMIARKRYLQQRQSIIYIQSKVRSKIAMKNYLQQRQSIIYLQSKVRCMIARKKYIQQRQFVIFLQSKVRCMIARKQYLQHKQSLVYLQSKVRCMIARKKYLLQKQSITYLQSKIRCVIARKKYLQQRESIIYLQSKVRCKIARKKYLQQRLSIIYLQSKFRCMIAMKNYLQQRQSVIYLQSKVRCMIARKKYLHQRLSIIYLQSKIRCMIVRKKYIQQRRSIIFLQSKTRCMIARKKYFKQKQSIIYLQSKIRCRIARKKYLHQMRSIIYLQAKVRCMIARKKYLQQRLSVIYLQSKFRCMIAMKNYLQQRQSVIYLQSKVRCMIARKKYIHQKLSIIYLQSKVRCMIVRKKYVQQRRSIIFLQSKTRCMIARKKYLKQKQSIIYLQSKIRCRIARKKYLHQMRSIICLQAKVRCMIARKKYLQQRQSIIYLQSKVRCLISRKLYLKQKKACITIQAFIRMCIHQKKYHRIHNAAISVQRYYRNRKIMKLQRSAFIHQKQSIIRLQSYVRCMIVQKKYLRLKNACILIQSFVRMHLQRKQFLKIKETTACLLRQNAAIILQANIRRFLCQTMFNKLKRSVQVIESHYLAYKAGVKDYELYNIKKRSCIKIQAFWRGYALRKSLKVQVAAAVTIQRAFRLWMLKRTFSSMKLLLQNQMSLPGALVQHLWYINFRRDIIHFQREARTYLLKRHKAATVIQSHFRRWKIQNQFKELKAAVKIQRAARTYLLKRHKAATVIQSRFRRWKIQNQFKELKAAVKIQSCWRAYVVRRSISNKKVVEARKRIKAADSSESNKLKNRTSRSLELLFKHSRVSSVMEALQELDVCTKLSPRCCERLVASGGLTILIQLLIACNRSIPHMEIIKITTNVLLNIAKYDKTVDYVWETENSLTTILRLMKAFREKGLTIFNKCCSLLSIFCQDPAKVEVMKCRSDVTEEIRSFHYLLKRKQNMGEKQVVSRGLSGKSFLNRTSAAAANISVLKKDSVQIEPDWMLGRNRCREFNDPFVGISWLMKVLELESK